MSSKSTFISTELDFGNLHDLHMGKHYILIDFAHLFAYPHISVAKLERAKIKSKFNIVQPINSMLFSHIFNLCSVYITFIGNIHCHDNEFNRMSSIDIIKYNFFTVHDDGHVTTYIDKMIELEYNYDKNYPDQIFKEIYDVTKVKIIKLWRDKYGNLELFDKSYNDKIPHSGSESTIFIDMLMKGSTEEEMRIELLSIFKKCMDL